MASNSFEDSCIFCKIIQGQLPSFQLLETEYTVAFLDVGPLADGHTLIIPKYHAVKLHQVPDEFLQDTLIIAKKIALALGCENYNVLENNGRDAHQIVDHVHFHVIPKPRPSDEEGLVIGWPRKVQSKEYLEQVYARLKSKL